MGQAMLNPAPKAFLALGFIRRVLSLLPQMKIEVILHIQTPVSPAIQMLGQDCWAQEFGAGLTI